ncbi:hypothetical protein [Cesiribacter andamanensis]|uniref:Uncharacterized protein n=1 Tax=Cesiribacter andamanensis AMV16 TaxID=1279009 RepID=M7N770_9BACT|nr:hypothetical protein [Cesiribacter andamanensis]EMR03117.1 hypothetical protein ADICEAN_01718 [Cesiribacter andamanensis AMV16]
MKQGQKLIFLFLAYGITLMHTLVPHQHNSQPVVQTAVHQLQEVGCRSVVGFLQFLFAADLGDNHLEIFKKSQLPATDLGFAGVLLFALASLLLFLAQLYRNRLPFGRFFHAHVPLQYFCTDVPLRAPPAHPSPFLSVAVAGC